MEQIVKAYIEDLRRQADEALKQVDLITTAFDLCESPIERQLLLAYLQLYPSTVHLTGLNTYLFVDEDLEDKVKWVSFIPQFNLHIGKKRLRPDFFFFSMKNAVNDPLKTVVVEVDGHDFHERTKEQACKDRSRDRLMLRHGFYVLRYTGSEVFKNAAAVVEEIREFVMPTEAPEVSAIQ